MRVRLTNGATRLGVLLALLLAPLPACKRPPARTTGRTTSPTQTLRTVAPAQPRPEAPLLIAVEDDAAPWSLADGSGYANDVVQAAFAASGVPIELKVVPYARAKQMALSGEAAACFSMAHAPENEAQITFPDEPLFRFTAECFEAVAKPLHAQTGRDLRSGTVLGVVIGYEYPPEVLALQQAGKVKFEEAASESLNFRKLAQGRIDAVLADDNEIKTPDYLLAKAGVQGQVRPAFSCGELACYIGFSRAHARGLAALAQYNAGFAAIKANGTLARIKQDWTSKLSGEMAALNAAAPGGGLAR